MKKCIFIAIAVIIGFCLFAGTRSSNVSDFHVKSENQDDQPSAGWWLEREINKCEIQRIYDSVDKYGFEEGVRKYNLDTLDISDEKLHAIKETAHEIAVNYGYLLNYD